MNNPILIFSHNYLVRDWETIVTEQLQLLLDTKLYQASTKIHYCVFAYENNAYRKFVNLVVQHDPLNKIQIIKHEENKFEFLTLKLLQDTIKQCDKETYVLYYHTKGLTSVQNCYNKHEGCFDKTIPSSTLHKNAVNWRKCLEYFNIEKWTKCTEALNTFDTAGALYIDSSGWPFNKYYSGNFWWSKTSYLKNLPDIDVDCEARIEAELWIGKNTHHWVNFHFNKGGNVYLDEYNPKEYRDDLK